MRFVTKKNLFLTLLLAIAISIFLLSVRYHVFALHEGTLAPNSSRVHNLILSAVSLPVHGLAVPIILFPLLFSYFLSLGFFLKNETLDFSLAVEKGIFTHFPLLLLLLHPLLVPFKIPNFGRWLALVSLLFSLGLFLLRFLQNNKKQIQVFFTLDSYSFFSQLRQEFGFFPGWLAGIPRFLVDHQFLLIIMVVGLGLRLHEIETRSLWWDEYAAFNWNQSSISELLRLIIQFDSHPPLFYLVERLFLQNFGFTIFAARLPMALFGVLAIPAAYLLALELFNRRTAVTVAILSAISPFAIAYAQEARMYAMLLALLSFAMFFLFRYLKKELLFDLLFFSFFTTLALWTHYMTLPFLFTFPLLALLTDKRKFLRPLITSTLLILVTFIPWILTARSSPLSGEFTRYLTHWLEPYPLSYIFKTPIFLFDGPFNPNGPWLMGIVVLPPLLAVWQLRQKTHWQFATLTLLLWLPIILEYLLSTFFHLLSGAAIFQVKHLIAALPLLLLILVASIDSLPRPRLRLTLIAILISFNLLGLLQYYQKDLSRNWLMAGQYLSKIVNTGDEVICLPGLALSSLHTYYKEAKGMNKPLIMPEKTHTENPEKIVDNFLAGLEKNTGEIHLLVREVGVRFGMLFPRDRLLFEKLQKKWHLQKVEDFDGSPRLRVLTFSKKIPMLTTNSVELTVKLDTSRLYLSRYFKETGLISTLVPELMLSQETSKRTAQVHPQERNQFQLTLPCKRFYPEDVSIHAIFNTGIKSGIIAHYFYIGESDRFSLTTSQSTRTIHFQPTTLQDPFIRILRDLLVVIFLLGMLYSIFLCLTTTRNSTMDLLPKGDELN